MDAGPLLLAIAAAAEVPALAEPAGVLDASDCVEVFGDAALKAERAVRRRDLVELVILAPGEVILAHSQDWDEPLLLRLRGVRVSEVDVVHQQATFELNIPPYCVGLFRAGVDDELGQGAPILAMLEDAVVVEFGGQLQYLQTDPDGRPPAVFWRSRWTRAPGGASATVPVAPRAPPPPRRR